jgi:hypothetical protein
VRARHLITPLRSHSARLLSLAASATPSVANAVGVGDAMPQTAAGPLGDAITTEGPCHTASFESFAVFPAGMLYILHVYFCTRGMCTGV